MDEKRHCRFQVSPSTQGSNNTHPHLAHHIEVKTFRPLETRHDDPGRDADGRCQWRAACSPLLFPIVLELGVDPIQFAAIVGVNLGMGNITPPTVPLLYLGSRVTQVPVKAMLYPTLIMILFAWIPILIITTYIPLVSLFLPELFLN